MSEQEEFINEFVLECQEGLDQLDNDLVELEASPRDKERWNACFRTLHTIKGNAGFLDFAKLGELAHAGETLMGRLRDGELDPTRDITDALLEMLDALRAMVKAIAAKGNEGRKAYASLKSKLGTLANLQEGRSSEPDDADTSSTGQGADDSHHAATQIIPALDPTQLNTKDDTATAGADRSEQDSGTGSSAVTLNYQPDDESAAALRGDSGVDPAEEPSASANQPSPPDAAEDSEEQDSAVKARSSVSSTAIRVDVDLLDNLMNLVGELVLSRNQLLRIMASRQDAELLDPTQRINALTSELQEGVMRTRMQQIGSIWQRYPRMVRDFARQCNKEVKLELSGGETELDKSLLEAIGDPLTHLIRNAIDHGIEKPYLRRTKGKPEEGQLTMRAFHEGGQVHIEIADDGAGIDLERIKQKAIQRGLIDAKEAESIGAAELRESIFMAGFSTADKITNVSGRGVGMDVVKTSIEEVGGTIEIDTEKDVGTMFRLTVPLTLAIVPALIVSSNDQQFAVPQINVVELLSLQDDGIRDQIEWFHDAPVLRLRGDLLPIVSLAKELKLSEELVPTDCAASVLVLKTGTRLFALIVEHIGNSQEIVVKPLGAILKGLREYAGATVMGDGSVALILDVLGIARRAGLFSSDKSLERAVASALTQDREVASEESLLVAEFAGRRRAAVPLANVIRLEDVPADSIEMSATQEVLQYRGEILPVVRLARLFGEDDSDTPAAATVIIYCHEGQQLALAVDRIVDIAERPTNRRMSSDELITATVVVEGRVTDVLDVGEVIRVGNVRFLEAATA